MNRAMIATVLVDNCSNDNCLEGEHGLSVFLETEEGNFLLDTGASDLLITNAIQLGVDLNSVDYVFVSHGHADHLGGLLAFLKMNSNAKVIMSEQALQYALVSTKKSQHSISINIDFSPYFHRFIFVADHLHLNSFVSLFSIKNHPHPLPKGNQFLFKEINNVLYNDSFDHEIVIAFGHKSLTVFTGCAHNGIANILETIKSYSKKEISLVLGGFHLIENSLEASAETDEEITTLANLLHQNYPKTQFLTGHCTSQYSYKILKSKLGDQLDRFYTGYTIQSTNN